MSPVEQITSNDSLVIRDLPQQVEKIVHSETFRSSEALRKLLEYLAGRVSDPNAGSTKAKEIAAAVFGRVRDFDPQNDSIVRVHATRLRAKLAEYYLSEGADDDLVIAVPKGAYTLAVHSRGNPAASNGDLNDNASDGAHPHASATANLRAWLRDLPSMRLPAVLMLLVVAVAGTWLLTRQRPNTVRQRLTPALATFWDVFLGTNDRILLVYSNIHVATAPPRDEIVLPSNGEVFGVYRFTRFFTALDRTVYPKYGNMFTWDEARESNLVFIGGPLADTPMLTVTSLRNFAFQRRTNGPGGQEAATILNLHPLPGEPAVFAGAPAPQEFDYAVVAMTRSLRPKSPAVIVAGISGYGTQGAAEFITHEERVEELLSRLAVQHGGAMPLFEAVIRFNVQGRTAIQPQIVALRKLN